MRKLQFITRILILALMFLLIAFSNSMAAYDIEGWICATGFSIYEEPDLNSSIQASFGGEMYLYIPFTEQAGNFYHIEFGVTESTGWCYLPECDNLYGEPFILSPDEMQHTIGDCNPILYSFGDESEDIRTVQQLINDIFDANEGYVPITINGLMDEPTIYHLSCFQETQGLPSTGMLDTKTYCKLQAFVQFKNQGADSVIEINQYGKKNIHCVSGWYNFKPNFVFDEDQFQYFYIAHQYTVNGESWYGIMRRINDYVGEDEVLVPDYVLDLISNEEYANTQEDIDLNVPNLTMDFYPAEKIDWYLDEYQWWHFTTLRVYDVYTGVIWDAHYVGRSGHLDAEPATVEDTARLCRIYGVSSAKEIRDANMNSPRPCLITYNGRTYACSLCGVPEEYYADNSDNKFNGQLCLFFNGSVDHSGRTAAAHMQAIQYAWEHAPNSNISSSPYMIRGAWGNLYWGINGNGQLTINADKPAFVYGCQAIDDFEEGSNAAWMQYKNNIQSIIIRSNISRIGDRAFKGIVSLNNISIPTNVVSIGKEAFSDCTELSEIRILGDHISIDDYAFSNCINLLRFQQTPQYTSLPGHITSLGNGVFMNCSSLTSLYLPSDITVINDKLCMNCSSLKNITFDGQITSIGDYAFAGCFPDQDTFQIPSSITSIGSYAFSNCNSFSHMVIPADTVHLSNHIFSGCTNIQKLTILSRNAAIDPLFLDNISNDIIIYGYSASSAEIFASTCSILFIDIENASANEDFIVENNILISYSGEGGTLWIPEGVEKIGENVFRYSTNRDAIEQVILPSTCAEIQDYAFGSCANLKQVFLPESLITIGNHAFSDCSSLKDIILPSSLQTLDYAAFCNCTSLVTINIPASVQNFSQYAFEKCISLKNVTIEQGLTNIPEGTFQQCTSLEEIVIPGSILAIKNYTFGYCSGLKRFIAQEGLQSIEQNAFYECHDLEALVLPSTITSISINTFRLNNKTLLMFAYANTDLHNLPYNCAVVCRESPDFVLPNNIQHIESEAFQNVSARWIFIPDGCLSIESKAFYNIQDLCQIRLPKNCHFEDNILYEWNQKIVIIGEPGSYAEEYALNHTNFTFLSNSEYNRLNAF